MYRIPHNDLVVRSEPGIVNMLRQVEVEEVTKMMIQINTAVQFHENRWGFNNDVAIRLVTNGPEAEICEILEFGKPLQRGGGDGDILAIFILDFLCNNPLTMIVKAEHAHPELLTIFFLVCNVHQFLLSETYLS